MPNEWPSNLVKHFESSFTSVQKLDISKDKVASVKVPVLTIHGTKDRNAPYGAGREWALILSNARLLSIKEGAHQSFDEFREIGDSSSEKIFGRQLAGRRRARHVSKPGILTNKVEVCLNSEMFHGQCS